MLAGELLNKISGAGITLTYYSDEDRLNAKPTAAVTPELAGEIKRHKEELIRIICEDEEMHRSGTIQTEREVSGFAGEVFTESYRSADEIPPERREELGRAAALGLVAKWSEEFGFIAIHDPTTGDWCDFPTKAAPDWAKWEARKRKELYRAGRRNAYRLTALQIQKIWDEEHMEVPEEAPEVTERGYVWEDHMEDAE
jgi:hypothetical protein